jgi:hypothetical protein
MQTAVRVAILGFGGLGKGMAHLIPQREDFQWVAVADSTGYAFDANGLNLDLDGSLTTELTSHSDAIIELLKRHGQEIDAVFMALPNLPVDFFADIMRRVLAETGFEGVFVDALKRTEAVERLLSLHEDFRNRKLLYITGAGATPGFLTTIAAVAAHSFVEVLDVNIHFGVGIANWESYKATVREDFIHLEGFDAKRVSCMNDEEIAQELELRGGLLNLVDMEHADDVILELAGVCPRDRVRVGGLVDTRNAKKPVSTSVTVTGRTASGAVGSHQFIVSNEATMVDNVCGPALGFMLRGLELYRRSFLGLMTSADLMPRFSTQTFSLTQPKLTREEAINEPVMRKVADAVSV